MAGVKDTIVEARNLGRLATALSLEDKVLSNGVLPDKTLPERAAVVQGIISEKLRTGRWTDVVKLVYDPKSNARLLYEGDRNALDNEIIESAKTHPNINYFDGSGRATEALDRLLASGRAGIVLQLIEASPMPYTESQQFLTKILAELDETQKTRAFGLVAERAGKEGRWTEAFSHYMKANDPNKADEVFESYIKNIKDFPIYSRVTDLVSMADLDPSKRMQRLVKIVESELALKTNAEKCFMLYKEDNLPLSEEATNQLYEAAAGEVSGWGDYVSLENKEGWRKIKFDSRLALLWAKKHATKDPQAAYKIFTALSYEGEEVLDAAAAGIKLNGTHHERHYALSLGQVKEEHLKALVRDEKRVELGGRADIARLLEDKEALIAFSREFFARGDNEKAYRFGIEGGSKQDSTYIAGIRRKLIEAEMTKEHPNFHFLHNRDSVGCEEAYRALAEKGDARESYEWAGYFARLTKDESLLNEARERIVDKNPVAALRYFDKDSAGRALALQAVAKKYDVPEAEAAALMKKFS